MHLGFIGLGQPLHAASMVKEFYTCIFTGGYGDEDFASVAELFRKRGR